MKHHQWNIAQVNIRINMNILKKKSRGNVTFWANGMLLIFIAVCMMFLLFTHEIINQVNYEIEDAITYSALGAATIDKERFAITNDIYVDDYAKCLKTFEELFSENTGCGDFIEGEASGDLSHGYFDFSEDKRIKIKKFIIYDVPTVEGKDGGYLSVYTDPDDPTIYAMRGEKYTYSDKSWASSERVMGIPDSGTLYYTFDGTNKQFFEQSPDIKTRTGGTINVPITKTCIYVEMEIPLKIKFFDIHATTTKSQIINIENR